MALKVKEDGRLHNNKVCIVFTEHIWMVVFFGEVDEHKYMYEDEDFFKVKY